MSTRTTNIWHVVPQVMSTLIQRGTYQMMYELTFITTQQMLTRTYVNPYPCQLVPLIYGMS